MARLICLTSQLCVGSVLERLNQRGRESQTREAGWLWMAEQIKWTKQRHKKMNDQKKSGSVEYGYRKELAGRVALVTGGTGGIGREAAIALATAGASAVVLGRRESEGRETVRRIELCGGEGRFIQADVADESDIRRSVAEVLKHYGRLDIAFNNAGVELAGPLTEVQAGDYERIFQVNVWGVLAAMKHEIPAMLASGGGSIINTSSIAGQVGMAGASVYVASKHAVEGLTKSAALEFASRGIRVNAVAPGLIDTDMADRFAGREGDMRNAIVAMHPLGRSGLPSEVAEVVVWLAGDRSSFITGHSLNVDGGFAAGK